MFGRRIERNEAGTGFQYIYIYSSLFIVAKLVAGMRKENGERMVGDVVNGGTTH